MKTNREITVSSKTFLIAAALALTQISPVTLWAAAPAKAQASPAEAQLTQKQFDSPKEAADALLAAAGVFDVAALKEILGPGSEDIVSSADPVGDKQRAARFAEKAKEKLDVGMDAKNASRAIITVGNDNFPLPIPIVKQKGKWAFDSKAGRTEVLLRRIGANELDAIAVCRGFVEAQHDYAEEKHDGSEVSQYAQKIISTPGKHDGLAWQNEDGTWGGPVGENVARAIAQGHSDKTQPFRGYYFKVLKGQGPAAPLGAMDFVVEDIMIGGFALVAAPAQYRVTGVKTFMVGSNGVVYEKDFGPNTSKEFESMEKYNPDKSWKETDDNWPADADAGDDTATQ